MATARLKSPREYATRLTGVAARRHRLDRTMVDLSSFRRIDAGDFLVSFAHFFEDDGMPMDFSLFAGDKVLTSPLP